MNPEKDKESNASYGQRGLKEEFGTENPNKRSNSMVKEKLIFRPQEIVWAKVKGHAWWPAVVSQQLKKLVSKNEYLQFFNFHFTICKYFFIHNFFLIF